MGKRDRNTAPAASHNDAAPQMTRVAPGAAVGHTAGRDVAPIDPKGPDGVARCWEVRGCEGVYGFTGYMVDECPHNVADRYSPCPATCVYTHCQRPWHAEATSLEDLLDPRVDRMSAIKEECRRCLHFIRRGPAAHPRDAGAVDAQNGD